MAHGPTVGPDAAPPLLVVCALGIERLALRGGDRREAAGPMVLLRTGMGPRAAERSMNRILATGAGPGPAGLPEAGHAQPPGRPSGPVARRGAAAAPGPAAVIATGFCAGLAPGMHPGDLVVADRTRDAAGSTACTGTDVLAQALEDLARRARRGPAPTVHVGPVAGSDRVVRGAERARLRATGAVAVDMESAATLRTAVRAGPRPVAAVRVVVDAPEHELLRIGTLRGGISAFRMLRSILPAFCQWHRSLPLSRR
ncbi:1-hydroxy-2-methyl-2-butenyl 4-diphosphate reductase [Streptomyces sp. NPDC057702]|uniref:phosphorylase family protein n=1 Tax=unclassified Streptomyces TaxID=2593676 RepID=UPI0036951453